MSESIYNFWHPDPSEREILESRVRRAYRGAREAEKGEVLPTLLNSYGVTPISDGSDPGVYSTNLSGIKRFMKSREGGAYRQRIADLRSRKDIRMEEIDLGNISDERRGRLYTSLQKLGPIVRTAGAVYSALNVAQRLYGLYIKQRDLNRIRELQERSSDLPSPMEVYKMSPEQVEDTMGRLERLEKQFETLIPAIYEILQRIDEGSQKTPQRTSLPATAVILVLVSLGTLLVLRQTTTFALRVSQTEIPFLVLGIIILGIISFLLFRKKK
ncbi:MAG: hypothetical protein GF368_03315 [Candidatus Aenigmarchaeota archaeon]|nr:hypothetical protein [Candidatus Aenigmarchaeota archaeon]